MSEIYNPNPCVACSDASWVIGHMHVKVDHLGIDNHTYYVYCPECNQRGQDPIKNPTQKQIESAVDISPDTLPFVYEPDYPSEKEMALEDEINEAMAEDDEDNEDYDTLERDVPRERIRETIDRERYR